MATLDPERARAQRIEELYRGVIASVCDGLKEDCALEGIDDNAVAAQQQSQHSQVQMRLYAQHERCATIAVKRRVDIACMLFQVSAQCFVVALTDHAHKLVHFA